MKKYYEYYEEISAEEAFDGLLGHGMFSEKLPPIFDSTKYCEYCKNSNINFDKKKWKPYIQHESIRNNNCMREIGIPNPFAYYHLCKTLSDNWNKIQEYFKDKTNYQQYVVSRIHIKKYKDEKILFKINYGEWKNSGSPISKLLLDSKYVVKADISTCFPSIYTHSIPWALVGKTEAKDTAGKNYENLWYNEIDSCTQKCKYGETHGLLIGPHASNVLSEIVLSAVDNAMNKWKYIRHIDDYMCFVKSSEEAHEFLVELNKELRKYDLNINQKKIEIIELPNAIEEQWVFQIKELLDTCYEIYDYKKIESMFNKVIQILKENNNNVAIINYFVKSLPFEKMSFNATKYAGDIILHLSLLYPYLVLILEEYVFSKCMFSGVALTNYVNILYGQELRNKNYEAVSYAIYFAIKYDLRIDKIESKEAILSDSCIFKLLSYIYFKKTNNKAEKKLMREHALSFKNDTEEFGKNWVFIYEVLPKSELIAEFKSIKSANLSFLKDEFRN